jgi:hypothetical protein
MAVRKRFTPTERVAFTAGTAIEWLHGSAWRAGVVEPTGIVQDDYTGAVRLSIRDTGPRTRTIGGGERFTVSPGAVRIA